MTQGVRTACSRCNFGPTCRHRTAPIEAAVTQLPVGPTQGENLPTPDDMPAYDPAQAINLRSVFKHGILAAAKAQYGGMTCSLTMDEYQSAVSRTFERKIV